MKGSGAATAHSGGIAVSGVQFGDNHLTAAPVARSAYVRQVRRVAPATLVGRDRELAELAEFCTRGIGQEWTWWQAPAWSGKSALMAWLVLHPPPGVRIVSFFITARWFGNSDRTAFLDVVLEQLAEVAERPVPAFLTDANREATFLDLLEQAAKTCRRAGERLVLVVDGLDEDRGVTADPDTHSIAALLPQELPDGMRVIVAGRVNPPVPMDVPEDHPLRDSSIIRPLSRSPAATVIRDQATREVKLLLRGTPAEQRLLGLVTAAGGGLSSRDLAALTGLPAWEVTDHLETVSGRTFTPRESHWGADGNGAALYVLAHEELRSLAAERLGGERLEEHRNRLHAWAEEYQGRGWPVDTPEYLLRGYFPMLRATHDLSRMIAFCLDSVRQNRLMELSGGDHTSRTEIATTLELIRTRESPDLPAACRLAIRRDHLQRRSAMIPPRLPVLWAALGDINRAETLARSITDPRWQVAALAELAVHVSKAGLLDRGRAIIGEAEAVAHSITSATDKISAFTNLVRHSIGSDADHGRELIEEAETVAQSFPRPTDRDFATVSLADLLIEVGDLSHAETLIRAITEPRRQAWPLANLGLAMLRTGDVARARERAEEAEARARISNHDAEALAVLAVFAAEAGDPDRGRTLTEEAAVLTLSTTSQKALMLAMLAGVVADSGDLDRARELAEEAENLTRSLVEPYDHTGAVIELANVVIEIGDLPWAETLIRSTTEPERQAWSLAELGLAMVKAGDVARARELAEEAETLAYSDPDLHEQAMNLARLATVVADAGEPGRARELTGKAEALARSITDPEPRAETLADLARIAVEAGDPHRARSLAEEAETALWSVVIPDHQGWIRSDLVGVMTQIGDLGRATALARSIADPYEQAHALTDLAWAAARADDLGFARDLVVEVESLARSITPEHTKIWALREVAGVLAETNDLHRAVTVARSITDPAQQATALADLSSAAAVAGDLDHAEALARSITLLHRRTVALAELAAVAAAAGEPDRARELTEEIETFARSITDPFAQTDILVDLAEVAADAGELDHARTLAERAEVAGRPIDDPDAQDRIRESLTAVMIRVGDPHRAETLARSIVDSDDQAKALAELTKAVARAGDIDHAERLAFSIARPEEQAEALASLASVSTPDRAQRYLVTALSLAKWTVSLEALAKTSPAVLREIAADFVS